MLSLLSDPARLEALKSYGLSAAAEGEFNDIVSFAATLCGTPTALVSFVEADRQVFKGRVGFDGSETPISQSICAFAMAGDDILVVPDATKDARFAGNTLVSAPAGVRFYAGAPLRADTGAPLGAVCVIDTVPREGLTTVQAQGLRLLADLVMARLGTTRQIRRTADVQVIRESAEAALATSEAHRQVIADSIPQLAWMANPDGGIHWYNKRWYEFTGRTFEEMQGWGWREVHHPDHVEAVTARFRQALAAESPWEDIFPLRGKDGAYRWFLSRAVPIRDEAGRVTQWFGTNTDITEQREIAQRLAQSEARFRTLADTMPQMVWTARQDGVHDYYNARWTLFTGLPAAAGHGPGWTTAFHRDDRDRVAAAWQAAVAGGEPLQIDFRLRRADGVYRWTLARALPMHEGDRVARWIGTYTDIDDARRLVDERELVAQELSHRIKNIFSVIVGLISLSAQSFPDAKGFAEQLRKRVHALGKAHNFVRPHSKDSAPAPGPASLHGLLHELLAPYGGAGSAQVTIRGADTPVDDRAATPIALVIHELATNAAKYGCLSQPGGSLRISSSVSEDRLSLEWVERGGPATAVAQPPSGFGTRLVDLSIEGQLGGTIERLWDQDGLSARVSISLAALTRHSPALAAS